MPIYDSFLQETPPTKRKGERFVDTGKDMPMNDKDFVYWWLAQQYGDSPGMPVVDVYDAATRPKGMSYEETQGLTQTALAKGFLKSARG